MQQNLEIEKQISIFKLQSIPLHQIITRSLQDVHNMKAYNSVCPSVAPQVSIREPPDGFR
jgi:hypothetical protein